MESCPWTLLQSEWAAELRVGLQGSAWHRVGGDPGDPLPVAGSVALRVRPPGLGWGHRVTEGQQGRGAGGEGQ